MKKCAQVTLSNGVVIQLTEAQNDDFEILKTDTLNAVKLYSFPSIKGVIEEHDTLASWQVTKHADGAVDRSIVNLPTDIEKEVIALLSKPELKGTTHENPWFVCQVTRTKVEL